MFMAFDDTIKTILATPQGMVDFSHYPQAAIVEVAAKYAMDGTDRTIRECLLKVDGRALTMLLQDLQTAARRHGANDVVELTNPKSASSVA
jgi:hypothetical protein